MSAFDTQPLTEDMSRSVVYGEHDDEWTSDEQPQRSYTTVKRYQVPEASVRSAVEDDAVREKIATRRERSSPRVGKGGGVRYQDRAKTSGGGQQYDTSEIIHDTTSRKHYENFNDYVIEHETIPSADQSHVETSPRQRRRELRALRRLYPPLPPQPSSPTPSDLEESPDTLGADDGTNEDRPASSFEDDSKTRLIRALASRFSNQFGELRFSKFSPSLLADALLHFSLLFHFGGCTTKQRRLLSFIFHNRNDISRCMTNGPYATFGGLHLPSFAAKVERQSEADPFSEFPSDDALIVADGMLALPSLMKGPEFESLSSWVKISCSIMPTGNTFYQVRRDLIGMIGHVKSANFDLEWDPLSFMRGEYNSPGLISLGEVLCLVGSGTTVQATTCAQYVNMLWPTFGAQTLKALDHAFVALLKYGFHSHPVNEIRPEASLRVSIHSSGSFMSRSKISIVVHASNSPSLIEIGEVLTWISSVCQPSTVYLDRIAYLCPDITKDDDGKIRINHREWTVARNPVFDNERYLCWGQIFKDAIVCVGYPVEVRQNNEKGLQIPLDVMATLGCATTATLYGAHTILKGLCSVFIPVTRVRTSILWHYVLHEDMSWMSHNVVQENTDAISNLSFHEMENARHFVGWSGSVREMIGSPDFSYNEIHEAKVRDVGPGYAWDSITIGFSKVIEVSTKFSVGKRDSRLYFQRGGTYPRTVDIAAGMNVVFYDEPARRAWLTDGSSALLLLTRTALSSSYSHGAGNKSPAIIDQFDQAAALLSANASASDILLSDQIRAIRLYGDDDHPQDSWCFENLVLEQWNLLDEMRSRQVLLSASANRERPIRLPVSTRIEGFQFVDMISCAGPLHRKYKDLPVDVAWSALRTKMNAVTIFGSSFGQLFQPLDRQCKTGLTLPSDCDILVAPNRILNPRLPGRGGEIHDDCVELVDGVFWADPDHSFPTEPCPCTDRNRTGSCSKIVTVLEHVRSKKLKGKRAVHPVGQHIFERFPNGAIVIGSEASARKARAQYLVSDTQLSSQNSRDSGYHSGSSAAIPADSSASTSAAKRQSVSALISATLGQLPRALGIKTTNADP